MSQLGTDVPPVRRKPVHLLILIQIYIFLSQQINTDRTYRPKKNQTSGQARTNKTKVPDSVVRYCFLNRKILVLCNMVDQIIECFLSTLHIGLNKVKKWLQLRPRLVAGEIGAARGTVATVITVAFRLYLVIIVQTMTN